MHAWKISALLKSIAALLKEKLVGVIRVKKQKQTSSCAKKFVNKIIVVALFFVSLVTLFL